jgi:hypothetical protein
VKKKKGSAKSSNVLARKESISAPRHAPSQPNTLYGGKASSKKGGKKGHMWKGC